jgi:hypothetical protein
LQTQSLQAAIDLAVTQTRVSQVVVMGNFKQGPTILNATSNATLVQPINELAYGSWLQALYQDPAAADKRCTYCNSLSVISPYLVRHTAHDTRHAHDTHAHGWCRAELTVSHVSCAGEHDVVPHLRARI